MVANDKLDVKLPLPIVIYYPRICAEKLNKTKRISTTIFDLQAEIWNQDLANTKQAHSRECWYDITKRCSSRTATELLISNMEQLKVPTKRKFVVLENQNSDLANRKEVS
jgi:hypothetical protein